MIVVLQVIDAVVNEQQVIVVLHVIDAVVNEEQVIDCRVAGD